MLETVAGASPVTRASSAWVKTPSASGSTSTSRGAACSPRSTSSTRCWFAERSDAGDPGLGSVR